MNESGELKKRDVCEAWSLFPNLVIKLYLLQEQLEVRVCAAKPFFPLLIRIADASEAERQSSSVKIGCSPTSAEDHVECGELTDGIYQVTYFYS